MKNKTRLFYLLISLPLLIGAKVDFNIYGVEGKLLDNIQARLSELKQRRPLNQLTEEELRQQIAEAMQPYGYFRPEIKLQHQPLQIDINTGPQMRITQLSISLAGEGASNTEIRKALASLPISQGQAFNSAKYEEAKQNLMNAAEQQGYLHSSFDKAEILINETNYTADIILVFNTGSQYYFGQVKFDPTYISPELLRRYIPFKQGQPYSTEQVLLLNNQLANSGYFRNISVKPQIGTNQRYIPVDVRMQRASRVSYSLGIGYGTDTNIRGRLGYHVVPVNRAGHKFNAIAIGSFGQSILQAQYIIPGKNPVNDEYHITGNLSALDYDAGYSKSALVSLSQHHSLPQFQRILSINGLYDGYHYYHAHDEENFTLYPKASFTWLKTKDKLFSPSGYNVTISGLGTTKLLTSQSNFIQASLNAKAALTIPSLRTRFYFHTFQGITEINDINRLPLSLALLLGGADNLKAYNFNSIGPGRLLTYGGMEIQKETKEHWYLLGFLDSGDVFKPNPKRLKNDLGIGLMWVSPIGPIKIGIAQEVNSRGDRQRKSPKLVVSMGPDL